LKHFRKERSAMRGKRGRERKEGEREGGERRREEAATASLKY
jgi:hypothetical protein